MDGETIARATRTNTQVWPGEPARPLSSYQLPTVSTSCKTSSESCTLSDTYSLAPPRSDKVLVEATLTRTCPANSAKARSLAIRIALARLPLYCGPADPIA